MAGMTDEYGLTAKQRKFCENVVSGMNLAESYRNSYDAENMKPASVQRRAAELMVDGRIRACMEALAVERRRLSEVSTVSDRDMLVTMLRQWSRGEVPATQTQLRAAELLGKACGLYRDVIEDNRERPAALVAADLERRLASLLASQQSSVTVNVVERVNAADDDDDIDDIAASDAAGSGLQ
jgi:hypothetical protein